MHLPCRTSVLPSLVTGFYCNHSSTDAALPPFAIRVATRSPFPDSTEVSRYMVTNAAAPLTPPIMAIKRVAQAHETERSDERFCSHRLQPEPIYLTERALPRCASPTSRVSVAKNFSKVKSIFAIVRFTLNPQISQFIPRPVVEVTSAAACYCPPKVLASPLVPQRQAWPRLLRLAG